jgi:hypothetical protein
MRRVYVMDAVKRAKSDRTSNRFMCSELQTWPTRILAELSLLDRPEIEGTMMPFQVGLGMFEVVSIGTILVAVNVRFDPNYHV